MPTRFDPQPSTPILLVTPNLRLVLSVTDPDADAARRLLERAEIAVGQTIDWDALELV
jgi:hypothetical protein